MTSNNIYIAILLSLLLHAVLLSLRWPQATRPAATGMIQNISVILAKGQDTAGAVAAVSPAGHQLPRDKVQSEKAIPQPPHYLKKRPQLIRQSPWPVIAPRLKSPAKTVVLSRHSFRSSPQAAAAKRTAAAVINNGTGAGQEVAEKKTGGKNCVPASPLYSMNPLPPYPNLARRLGLSGVVLLEVLVDTGGSAANIWLIHSSGHTILDRAAARAVQHWRFRPGSINGAKQAMRVKVPIRFRLQ